MTAAQYDNGHGVKKPAILVVGHHDHPEPFPSLLKRHGSSFDLSYYDPPLKKHTREQLINDLLLPSDTNPFYGIDGLFCWGVGFDKAYPINQEIIDLFPDTIKIVVMNCVGHEFIDVDYLKKKNIIYCNLPSGFGGMEEQVADTALYLGLTTFRHFNYFEDILKSNDKGNGNVKHTRSLLSNGTNENSKGKLTKFGDINTYSFGCSVGNKPIHGPFNKNCCIVGLGKIGKCIARRFSALGMDIHYHKTKPLTKIELEELSLQGVRNIVYHSNFEDLLKVADLLVMCLPITKKTYHILNSKTLELLPKGSRIVNVGRGNTINETDLLNSLKSGHISSVGLDVFENELNINEELLNRWDVTLLPHIGSATVENYRDGVKFGMKNLQLFFDGEKLLSQVN